MWLVGRHSNFLRNFLNFALIVWRNFRWEYYLKTCQNDPRKSVGQDIGVNLRFIPSMHVRGFAVKGRSVVELLKLVGVFMFAAVALGFFASIGIWAAVSFLRLFGIETL